MTGFPRAIVETISFDVETCVHLFFRHPVGMVVWEDRREVVFPHFAGK